MLIGVISDTHGLIRPDALRVLAGSDAILHAGDIGSQAVLDELEGIAPVFPVRGNIDEGKWGQSLPRTQVLPFEGALIYMLHDIHQLDLDPVAAGIAAVVFGHSHKPVIERRDGVLFFNPGSAGPRRFKLPIAVGRLTISGATVMPEIVTLA